MSKKSNHQYVKVKKGLLVDCFTCPLCLNLLREATTICVCLHTFCKECIYQKLADDESYCCPICSVYLGCLPEEKLRLDNNLQDLKMKLFPLKNSKQMESTSTLTTPARRKQRSLSSLVISTNPVSRKPALSRGKAISRKAGMTRGGTISKLHVDRVGEKDDHLDKSFSVELSNKLSVGSKKQRISSNKEPPPIVEIATKVEPTGNAPDWESLTLLAEAANKTIESNIPLLGLPASQIENNGKVNLKNIRKLRRAPRSISSGRKNEVGKVEDSNIPEERPEPGSNGVVKVSSSNDQGASVNGCFDRSQKILHPVWFSLLASKDPNGVTFPQIPKSYIRIRDGTIPVSYINKYLVHKLNLRHETEVEITCCDQTLAPNATLNSLVDIWVQHAPNRDSLIRLCSRKNETYSNIENYVMVLKYRRK